MLLQPVPNVYSFTLEGAQGMAGAGAYAFHELGWRNVVTVGDAEAFNYTQAAGFLAEFCALGGKVSRSIWVPLSTQDRAPYVAQVPPRGVDGFVMVGNPGLTAAFTRSVPALTGNLASKVILGILSSSLQGLDPASQASLSESPCPPRSSPSPRRDGPHTWPSTRRRSPSSPASVRSSSPSPTTTRWKLWSRRSRRSTATSRTTNSGSDPRWHLLELEAPQGDIRLDENRRAVGPNYLLKVVKDPKVGSA